MRAFAVAAVILTAVSLSGCGSGGTTTVTPTPVCGSGLVCTIVDTAIAIPDLSTLVGALTTADLVTTLNGTGPFTVFAPTNEAFAAIQDTVDGLDVTQLTDVLLAHVVAGKFLSTDLSDGQVVPTLFPGANVTVHINGGVVTIESDSNVIGTVSPANVECTNGVVHVVSAVLVPTGLPAATTTGPAAPTTPSPPPATTSGPAAATTTAAETDIVDTAIATPDLSTLVGALTTADLVDTLKGTGPFTVFAPTNEAFAAIQATVDGLDVTQLTDVLLAHVVSGAVLSSDLTDGQVVPTLFPGASVTVGISAAGVVTITSDSGAVGTVGPANVLCTNGVVHVVSAVLVPTGLPADVTTSSVATISV